ncbi:unnamed protein product [Lampetra fluviatilis]
MSGSITDRFACEEAAPEPRVEDSGGVTAEEWNASERTSVGETELALRIDARWIWTSPDFERFATDCGGFRRAADCSWPCGVEVGVVMFAAERARRGLRVLWCRPLESGRLHVARGSPPPSQGRRGDARGALPLGLRASPDQGATVELRETVELGATLEPPWSHSGAIVELGDTVELGATVELRETVQLGATVEQ